MSSKNATRHGFYGSAAVAGVESRKEIKRLIEELSEEYRPLGRVENELVSQIAYAMWRLRRIAKIETEEWLLARYEKVPSSMSISRMPLDRIERYEANARRAQERATKQLLEHQERRKANQKEQPQQQADEQTNKMDLQNEPTKSLVNSEMRI